MRGIGKGMKGGTGGGGRRGFHDPLLLHRVAECVADASHRKRPLDPDDVADSLRRTHREYQRKQRGPFLRGVAQAIQIVLARTANAESRGEQQLQQLEECHLAARQGAERGGGGGGRGGGEGQSDSEERGEAGTRSERTGAEGEEESEEEEGASGAERSGGVGGEEQYKDAEEEQRGDEEGESQEQGLEGRGREGALSEGFRFEEGAEDGPHPRPGAPSAESASLATCDSSRHTSGVSTAQAKGTPQESADAVPAGQEQRKRSCSARKEGERASGGAKGREALDQAKNVVPAVTLSNSALQKQLQQQPDAGQLEPKAEAAGAPPAHLPSQAGSGKKKRQAASPHPAPDPQSKRRRQASALQGGTPASSSPPLGSTFRSVPRRVSLSSLGGIEGVLSAIQELILQPLAHPELYMWLGVEPPRGVLLHGPPGCGKTMLAHAIAHEAQVPFFKISAPEIVSGMSGESEAKIRDLFREAEAAAPSVVFIDEIDAITPKRETAQREMERRIVAQLLTCIDDLGHTPGEEGEKGGSEGQREREGLTVEKEGEQTGTGTAQLGMRSAYRHVVVLGATNRPDALDPALRRAGRFDREISVGIPDEAARARILEVLSRGLRLEGGFDFRRIARRTAGFVGADLAAVAKEAAALAVKRILSGGSGCAAGPGPPTAPGDTTAFGLTTALGCTNDQPRGATGQAGAGMSASMDAGMGGPETRSEAGLPVQRHPGTGTEVLREGNDVGPLEDQCGATAGVLAGQPLGEGRGERRGAWSIEDMQGLSIRMGDFEGAVSLVQPSAKREGFSTIPGVTWADVGALGPVREELRLSISRPILFPEEFQALGLTRATGVLLYGPPGCGKTLVAKAIANDAGANFISIKGPELLNKFVGESERAVRQLFQRARSSSPCILFFDEMDAMAPRRGTDSNGAAERVVNQLLTEMDGLEGRGSVFIVAATNRPDMLDPALLRPGRLDKLLYVPLPDEPGRVSILQTLLKKVPSVSEEVNARELGADPRCARFSGADLAALVREACVAALRERLGTSPGDSAPTGDGILMGGTAEEDRAITEGTAAMGELGERTKRSVETIAGMGSGVPSSSQDGPMSARLGPAHTNNGVTADSAGKDSKGAAGAPVICVRRRHFEAALQRIRPSVSPQDLEHYEGVKNAIHGARGHLGSL